MGVTQAQRITGVISVLLRKVNMLSNWQVAKVVHSVPEASWGLAETSEKKVIFFRSATSVKLQLQGTDLIRSDAANLTIPPTGSEIVFRGLIPAERGGKYPQAMIWTSKERFEEMRPSAEKAAATLARLAAENAVAERKRREAIERSIMRSAGRPEGKNKQGKKAHASA